MVANEIYKDTLIRAYRTGSFQEDELVAHMRRRGLWTDHDEEQQEKLKTAIEDMKVGLYENWSQSNARLAIRTALKKGKEETERLFVKRHRLDHMTCSGIAAYAKARFLIGSSLVRPDGRMYWESESGWDEEDDILDEAIDKISELRLGEAEFRDIARSDPWRSVWSSHRNTGNDVFGIAAVDLSEDQRNLLLWSGMYDSIKEHPNAPDDNIVEDDDMLDGWMIVQRRKHEHNKAKKRGDEISNEKIRNAGEVYMVANTIEDAREIDKMNDMGSRNIKAQRMAFLRTKKEVNEVYMPDTWQGIQMELNRLEAKKMRGK